MIVTSDPCSVYAHKLRSRIWPIRSRLPSQPASRLDQQVAREGVDLACLHPPIFRSILEMFIKHNAPAIDETGEIVNHDTRKFLQSFVDRYVARVKTHGGTR